MKLIGIYANHAAYNNHAPSPLYNKSAPIVYAMADTALLTGGRPFFVPDYARPCVCCAELAVRICRLGRYIAPRFAHRYYDAFTVAAHFAAANLLAEARREGLPWDLALGFDGAASVGEMVPLDGADAAAIPFSLSVDGQEMQRGTTADLLRSIDECIAYVSRFYTLRQGDLLFTGAAAPAFTVAADCHVDGTAGGRHVLSFNVR